MTTTTRETTRIYQRARAFADLHFYQKWRAAWPRLARLPSDGVRLLDAGCGDGQWSLELARRRPGWVVCGVDRDESAVLHARARQKALGLANASFEHVDFSHFTPVEPFDVVLSVCSMHYGQTPTDTEQLFRQLREWIRPTGQLVLIVPRTVSEVPFIRSLAHPAWHPLFTRDRLVELCHMTGLVPAVLEPMIGRIGTVAKQLDWARVGMRHPARGALAVVARTIAFVDAHLPIPTGRSLLWILVGRRA